VVIQHDTEIGENLPVTFYSIYMHLGSIETILKQGSDIHRKGKLGKAGIVSDQEDQIHFEIIADEANIKKLIGDLAFNAPNYHVDKEGAEKAFQAQDGRKDACFGNMYFFVPQGSSICEKTEVEEEKTVSVKNKRTGITSQQTVNVKKTVYVPKIRDNGAYMVVGQHLYVEMAFDKGKCTLTSYDEDGKPIGNPVVTQGDSSYNDAVHEYNLYKASLSLYPSKPTAGFELLRFGRVLGDEDFATTETVTHFREILTPKGNYWVDFNKPYIKKYSDADFPYWKGWGISNDDTNGDSRCDSKIITEIIYNYWKTKSVNAQYIDEYLHKSIEKLQPYEKYQDVPDHGLRMVYHFKSMQSRQDMFATKEVQEKVAALNRVFYKFPTEWSMTDFDTRYAWVKCDIFENAEKSFQKFKNFVQALTFWDEAGIPIDKNHWHCPPIEFIKHFRKCSWLSDGELKQTFLPYVEQNSHWYSKGIKGATDLLDSLRVNLNKAFRKYCITTPLRMASFLGNAFEETIWMTTLEEKKNKYWYHPWGGRGILQLTHPDNYAEYWKFSGKTISDEFKKYIKDYGVIAHMSGNDPRKEKMKTMQDTNYPKLAEYQLLRKNIADKNVYYPTDSSGFYWASRRTSISQYADEEQKLEAVLVGTKAYYRSPSFWKVANVVNFGSYSSSRTQYGTSINGFPERCCGYTNCLLVLTELKFPDGQSKLEIPKGWKQRDIHGNDPQ